MFDTKSTQRLGNDGFIWFIGIVEDIDDPLQLGRLRVRILGDHTQSNKEGRIPTDSLPWAYVLMDATSSSMQGIGHSPTGMCTKGTWVQGFYWDSIDKQQPVITHTFGGIPESIPFNPSGAEEGNDADTGPKCGFQDPDEIFPMGHHIFEQDTNRLARRSPEDHAFEVPEDLVPKQEIHIEEGLCPKKPVYGKEYYDTFDEAYVRKFAQGEEKKDSRDDSVVDGETQGTSDLKVEDQEDERCQYFLLKNNHPFTIFKWVNKERYIPKAKVFHDEMHREYWHEPENKWDVEYPYNKVWEGYHEVGEESAENDGNNKYVTEVYGYDKSIEDYDGSEKEGIYRKQLCGYGSWGLGEEWDQTPGKNRYHRFTPSGNYLEIGHEGDEVRKIYGDSFEIDLKDRTLLVKGDWNITVEGDKNELIEGDYNLQIMKDLNIDVRTDINMHCDGNRETHVKEDDRLRVEGDRRDRIAGKRDVSILTDDYVESPKITVRGDELYRYGGELMHDEAFVKYEMIAHDLEGRICSVSLDVDSWEERVDTFNSDISSLTQNVATRTESVGILTSDVTTLTENVSLYNQNILDFQGCIVNKYQNVVDYTLIYSTTYLVEQGAFVCGTPSPSITSPEEPNVGICSYPETDGISQCMERYKESIEAAKGACMTTLIDPRTLEEKTRFDWEKYHASLKSAKDSYEACVEANKGLTCDVCAPEPGVLEWTCEGCHDPECPTDDKEWELYECPCECHSQVEEIFIDPWLECEQDKP